MIGFKFDEFFCFIIIYGVLIFVGFVVVEYFYKIYICYFNKLKFMIIIWINRKCLYNFEFVGLIKFTKMFKNSDETIIL